MLRFTITLTVICIAAALTLGITYSATSPLIAAQKEKETSQALQKVLPGADEYQKRSIDGIGYYEGRSGSALTGYAIFTEAQGYAGKIETLVGIDRRGKITGLEILAQSETPGLGARCVEVKYGQDRPWFPAQFKGRSASELDINNIETITGATITSKAIASSVSEQIESFLEKVNSR